jgi:hypothetical protein
MEKLTGTEEIKRTKDTTVLTSGNGLIQMFCLDSLRSKRLKIAHSFSYGSQWPKL